MSLSNVRPYFRTRMDAIGYREWPDGFSFDNIPSNILDKSYHVESGPIGGSSSDHQVHEFEYQVILRVFKNGFRNVGEALDQTDIDIDTILTEILASVNRLGDDIKDVIPDSIERIELSETNDNKIIIEFNFTVKIYKCF